MTCARPGYIRGYRDPDYVEPQYLLLDIPTVELKDCVAAVLKQCVEGIELDPILNDDLTRIGQEVLDKYYSKQ